MKTKKFKINDIVEFTECFYNPLATSDGSDGKDIIQKGDRGLILDGPNVIPGFDSNEYYTHIMIFAASHTNT